MTNKYFVLGTPGTSTTFLAHLLRNFVDADSSYPALVNQFKFSQEPPTIMTPEFYYDNLIIDNNLTNIFALPMRPDIETLRVRFPDCKIVVITHSIDEISYIANYYYKTFYSEMYDFGAEDPFKAILNAHSHLFSDLSATPSNLSQKEEEIFKKILQYNKLLDGYFNIGEPDSDLLIKISFSDILYQHNKVLEKISSFLGIDTPSAAAEFYKTTIAQILEKFLPQRNTKYHYES
jgi:hypothetical protein